MAVTLITPCCDLRRIEITLQEKNISVWAAFSNSHTSFW